MAGTNINIAVIPMGINPHGPSHLQISVYHVSWMNVFDRLKQLIHDEHLVEVLQDLALLNHVVEIGFWGNGPKQVSGQKSENRRGMWPSFEFFFGPGKTHPCTRIRDKYLGRCSPCEDRSVVWCCRDWRMIVETLSHGMYAVHPSDFWRHRRSSSPLLFPCFSCLSPSIQYRKPIEKFVEKLSIKDVLNFE